MSIDWFLRKRILVVVAHQDDESLYFGGLLSSISAQAEISLVSTTAPMPGRPDTEHRLGSFRRVGALLGCRKVWCLNLPDCGPRGQSYPPDRLVEGIAAGLASVDESYDLVLTHGALGEPNVVYGAQGHEAHRATHQGVLAATRLPIVACARGGGDLSFEMEYDVTLKKTLLDCYAPHWTTVDYPFAYDPEPYVLIASRGVPE